MDSGKQQVSRSRETEMISRYPVSRTHLRRQRFKFCLIAEGSGPFLLPPRPYDGMGYGAGHAIDYTAAASSPCFREPFLYIRLSCNMDLFSQHRSYSVLNYQQYRSYPLLKPSHGRCCSFFGTGSRTLLSI